MKWRCRLMGPVNEWHTIRKPIQLVVSDYDEQIRIDIARSHSEDEWLDPHRETLCQILNTFADTNVDFGYAQGLNYLILPLYQVYYTACPEWAVEDTFYSLQKLVGILMPMYPLTPTDAAAYRYLMLICAVVKLQTTKVHPTLRTLLFSPEYEPFVLSLVSNMVPTMFANIFSVAETVVLWDLIFASHNSILQNVVDCMGRLVIAHHNAIRYLSFETCLTVVQQAAPYSLALICNGMAR